MNEKNKCYTFSLFTFFIKLFHVILLNLNHFCAIFTRGVFIKKLFVEGYKS